MTAVGVVLGLVFGSIGVFLIICGVLAWRGKLPGNPAFGIRVPEVRKSQGLWDLAHRVAGPLWTLSGVCFVIAALVSVIASGWMWLIPITAAIAGLVFLGMGAGMGAHTVAIYHANQNNQATSSEPPAADSDKTVDKVTAGEQAAEDADQPAIDLAALRAAAKAADPEDKD